MNETKIKHTIEYLSLILILSYLVLHSIFLVMIGIIFSLYLIDDNFITSIIKSIDKNLINKKVFSDLNINEKEIKPNPININSSKGNSKITLVDTIEELGFIPSLDKNKDSDAA